MASTTQLAFDANGTLSRVWLAAHWDKKLTKNSICSHDIVESVSTIKSPGNVYSLRISGYLLLGLTKIYSKKSIITLEELEQALQTVTQSTSQSAEVLKEIGITDIPEKIKLAPLKKPESLNPLVKSAKNMLEKPKNPALQEYQHIEEAPVEDNDTLGVTTSFLDDVEMAEQWLRKDPDDEINLPSKRPREKIWQSFISVNVIDVDTVIPDPAVLTSIKRENNDAIDIQNTEFFVNIVDTEEYNNSEREKEKEREKEREKEKEKEREKEKEKENVRIKHRKKIIKDPQGSLMINPELHIGLDCTADIVKNTRLYQTLDEILPNDIEQIFYIPIFRDIAPELENFYLSHIKIQRLKNLFREEEKEPVILSNTAPERPENPSNPVVESEVHVKEPIPEPEMMPKIEKVEDKTDESWNSRTLRLLKLLQVRLRNQKVVYFEDLSKKSDRKIMACGFYEALQLCFKDFIIMEEHEGKILLKSTERLTRMSLS